MSLKNLASLSRDFFCVLMVRSGGLAEAEEGAGVGSGDAVNLFYG